MPVVGIPDPNERLLEGSKQKQRAKEPAAATLFTMSSPMGPR